MLSSASSSTALLVALACACCCARCWEDIAPPVGAGRISTRKLLASTADGCPCAANDSRSPSLSCSLLYLLPLSLFSSPSLSPLFSVVCPLSAFPLRPFCLSFLFFFSLSFNSLSSVLSPPSLSGPSASPFGPTLTPLLRLTSFRSAPLSNHASLGYTQRRAGVLARSGV